MRRALFVAAVAAALTVTGGTAVAAGVPPTPNGQVGACNMMRDPFMTTRVMETTSAQGMQGMMRSHEVSGCSA